MAIDPARSGGVIVAQDPNDAVLNAIAELRREQNRQSRLLYNYSKPVDEYEYNQTPFAGPVTIQAQYGLTEHIQNIVYSLPIGITGAVLQLGRRFIPLLQQGAATTVQTVNTLINVNAILEGNDARVLTFTGTPTSGYYIGLNGYRLER